MMLISDTYVCESSPISSNATTVLAGSITGVIIAMVAIASVLLMMVLIQLRKRSQLQYTINSDSDATERQLENPIYDG